MSTPETGPKPDGRRQPTAAEFREMQASTQFGELRRAFRLFTFPMSCAFFVWYLCYVVTATFAPEFMGVRLVGFITVGLVLGFLQFVTTFAITWIYVRYANATLGPRSAEIRCYMEGEVVPV